MMSVPSEFALLDVMPVRRSLLRSPITAWIATSVAGAIAVSFPLSAHHASAIWDKPPRPCGAPMSDRVAAVTRTSSPAIEPITFAWSWRETSIPVEYEMSGPAGAEPILLLPALSTVSTRDELRALARHLEIRRCIITDWPGFGDKARPRLDYDCALCRGFLEAPGRASPERTRETLVPGDRLRHAGGSRSTSKRDNPRRSRISS